MDRNELEKMLSNKRAESEPEKGTCTVDGRELTEMEKATQYVGEDIFEVIKVIRDPEHKDYSLSDLGVVKRSGITLNYYKGFKHAHLTIFVTPTVPHCHLTTHIALCIHERTARYLPPETKWKLNLYLTPGSHDNEGDVNKQINDKERVIAGLENKDLLREIMKCTDDEICTLT